MEVLTSYTTWQFTLKAQFSLPQLAESLIKTPEPNSVQRPQEIFTTWLFMACYWNTTHTLNSTDPAACFYYKQEQLKWDEWGWGSKCLCYCNCSQQQQTFREVDRDFLNTSSWPLSFTSLVNPHQLNGPNQDLEGSFPHKYPNHKLYRGAQLTDSAPLLAFQGWSAEAGDRRKHTNLIFYYFKPHWRQKQKRKPTTATLPPRNKPPH